MYFSHNDYDKHCWKMTSGADKVLAEDQEQDHTSITLHPPFLSSGFLSLCLPLIPDEAFVTSQPLNT